MRNNGGNYNTFTGYYALHNGTISQKNIAVGYQGGYNITTGSSNIEIGSQGTATDSNIICIGNQGTETATYVAGISATLVKGADVQVNSSGQWGIATSSARYKRDIRPLYNRSQGLWQLRL